MPGIGQVKGVGVAHRRQARVADEQVIWVVLRVASHEHPVAQNVLHIAVMHDAIQPDFGRWNRHFSRKLLLLSISKCYFPNAK